MLVSVQSDEIKEIKNTFLNITDGIEKDTKHDKRKLKTENIKQIRFFRIIV